LSSPVPIFFHRFALETSSGNRCTQPLVAVLEAGSIRWLDTPGEWLRPASEDDLAECRRWAADAANETRKLMDGFRKQHTKEHKT
jgi:hypothetical protein